MKTLQDALIAAGRESIPFANGQTDYPVDVADLPEATLLKIFDYGKRIFNDSVNSSKHQGKDAGEAAAEWMTKAKAGTLGTRAGGARISPIEKAIRGLVVDYLKAAGWDTKTAAKDAKEPKLAFGIMLGLQLARGKGIPVKDVEDADIQTALAKNWPKITERAEAMVAISTSTLDIEI